MPRIVPSKMYRTIRYVSFPISTVISSYLLKSPQLTNILFKQDRRPFGDLEFQVSAVVERLEAGVNSQERNIERRKPEPPKISKSICKAEAMPLGDILNLLADMVVSNDFNGDSCEPAILPLDIVGRAAILSHSLAALLNRLQTGHAARIGAHIASETTLWLSHMIRYVFN